MKPQDYQKQASRTRRLNWENADGPNIVILGIIGELGSLASVLKKHFRDRQAYANYKNDFLEEAGDILWYVTSTATHIELHLEEWPSAHLETTTAPECLYGLYKKVSSLLEIKDQLRFPISHDHSRTKDLVLDIYKDLHTLVQFVDSNLEEIADLNCNKILSYWCVDESLPARQFDKSFPEYEQLPRKFNVDFVSINDHETILIMLNGFAIGDRLTDNAHSDDGYRFHDVFHLTGIATLGWSPVFRRMLKRKRKSSSKIDEVEDGARAAIIEEAIINHIYDYARPNFLEGMSRVDLDLINRIRDLVQGYEVSECEPWEWQDCILKSYQLFREIKEKKSGRISIDCERRLIELKPLPEEYCHI
jgi:NTP pyrophosphatase (non-canonical NTP hydrolase)